MPADHPRWKQIDEKLEENHKARIVERQVNRVDRECLDKLYRDVGSIAFDPVALLKIVLYQILKGNRSPATWYEEAKLNEATQWLGRGYTPAQRTWYLFRDRVGDAIESLHQQLISGAIEQELVDPHTGVQDGTSVAACASRHRMINQETLQRRTELLDAVIDGIADDDRPVPLWVPPTASGRLDLAERMRAAFEVLSERIAKNAAKPSDKRKDPAKIVVSLTDPIAPLGRDKFKVYRPLYTVQYVVEPISRLILCYCCEASANDAGTLAPMIDQTQAIVGGKLETMMADAAYCSILDLRDCKEREIELLAPVQSNSFTEKKARAKPPTQIPRDEFTWNEQERSYCCPAGHELDYIDRTRKRRHGDRTLWEYRFRCRPEHCGACPLKAQCLRPGSASRTVKRLEGQELIDAQREKMADPTVQARYAARGQTVELGFADAKAHRGLARFHGRGLQRAETETGLLVLAQNLLRLDRLQQDSLNPYESRT
jgi:transposase